MNDDITPSPQLDAVDEQAREAARQRMIGRRRMIRAGLVAVPVLMTLRAVPAYARLRQTTKSRVCPTGSTHTKTGRCVAHPPR